MAKTVYDLIKQQNGEHFAKAIRNYDNGIFDIPNIVDILKYAGREAEPVMNYLVSLKNVHIEEQSVHMNPIDLLDKAGYKAWEVHNEQEQNAIAGYFRDVRAVEHNMTGGNPRSDKGELVCTVHTNWKYDERRFDANYIINAVKKECLGDDKLPESQWHIKPSKNPKREDEYGTSVISIQVYKNGGFIRITNRYNHTVANPDNTFNSNPDNIIHGLSDAIKHYFDVDFSSQRVELPNHYITIKNKIIRYNKEINGVYFADDLYVKNGKIIKINTQSQLLLPGGLLLDVQNKTVTSLLRPDDNLAIALTDVIKDKKIQITKNANGEKEVLADGKVVFRLAKTGGLFKYLYVSKFFNDDAGKDVRWSDYFVSGGIFDLRDVKCMRAYHTDFSNVNVRFNSKADDIRLEKVKGLKGKVNFSEVKRLKLQDTDLSEAKVKFNSKADEIDISVTGGAFISGSVSQLHYDRYDFSKVKELRLDGCIDLTDANILLNKDAESIEIESCGALKEGQYDLSNVKSLLIRNTDLSKANITFNPDASYIELFRTGKLAAKHYGFDNVKDLRIWQTDLSKADITFNSKAIFILLYNITRLKGFHNFSDVESFNLDPNFNAFDKHNVFDKNWKNAISKTNIEIFKSATKKLVVINKKTPPTDENINAR
ncbi:MAG: hypothetical protein IJL05_03750 [Alphaproteobacteria bacterium]|nr:hypothetical protein [Alphaproteobacteria bacterium]